MTRPQVNLSPNAAMMSALQNVAPKYEVHRAHGEVTRTVYGYVMREDEHTGRKYRERVEKEVTEPMGFMVYFPRGHSIRVRNEEVLTLMGLDEEPGLVDMESGDEIPLPKPVSLKARAEQVVRGKKLTANTEEDD